MWFDLPPMPKADSAFNTMLTKQALVPTAPAPAPPPGAAPPQPPGPPGPPQPPQPPMPPAPPAPPPGSGPPVAMPQPGQMPPQQGAPPPPPGPGPPPGAPPPQPVPAKPPNLQTRPMPALPVTMGKASEEIRRRLYKKAGSPVTEGLEAAGRNLDQIPIARRAGEKVRGFLNLGRHATPPPAAADDLASGVTGASAWGPRAATATPPPATGGASGSALPTPPKPPGPTPPGPTPPGPTPPGPTPPGPTPPGPTPPGPRGWNINPLLGSNQIGGNLLGGAYGYAAPGNFNDVAWDDSSRAWGALGGAVAGGYGNRALVRGMKASPMLGGGVWGQIAGTGADQVGHQTGLYDQMGIGGPDSRYGESIGGLYYGPGTELGGLAGLGIRSPIGRNATNSLANRFVPPMLRPSSGGALGGTINQTARSFGTTGAVGIGAYGTANVLRNQGSEALESAIDSERRQATSTELSGLGIDPEGPNAARLYNEDGTFEPLVAQSVANKFGRELAQNYGISADVLERNLQYQPVDPNAPEGTPRMIDWVATAARPELATTGFGNAITQAMQNPEQMQQLTGQVTEWMSSDTGRRALGEVTTRLVNTPEVRQAAMDGIMGATGLGQVGEIFNNILGFMGLDMEGGIGQALGNMNPLMKGLLMVGAIGLPLALLTKSKVGGLLAGAAVVGGIAPAIFTMLSGNRSESTGAETASGQQNADAQRRTSDRVNTETQAANTYQHTPDTNMDAWLGRANTLTPDAVQAMTPDGLMQMLQTVPRDALNRVNPQVLQQISQRAQQLASTNPQFAQQYNQLLRQIYAAQQPTGSPSGGDPSGTDSANVPGSALP